MIYKPGDSAEQFFCLRNPDGTGAVNDDTTPTGVVKRNGSTEGAVTVTVTSTGTTGEYKATWTMDAGWSAGDRVSLTIAATVGSVTERKSFGPWILDSKRHADFIVPSSRTI